MIKKNWLYWLVCVCITISGALSSFATDQDDYSEADDPLEAIRPISDDENPEIDPDEGNAPPIPEAAQRKSEYISEFKAPYWYRAPEEWISGQTVRNTLSNQPASHIYTDGKRFDVALGKRKVLFTWGRRGRTTAWVLGFDGGVGTTLTRVEKSGSSDLVFGTETFDGHFGGFIGRGSGDFIWLARIGHLSAHLVDNSPRLSQSISYSRFWVEGIVNYSFVPLHEKKPWALSAQAMIGANYKSTPSKKNPRYGIGITGSFQFWGFDSWGLIFDADLHNPGVENQDPHFNIFVGLGHPKHAYTTNHPWKIGINHMGGSESRNQFFTEDTGFTSLAIQMDL